MAAELRDVPAPELLRVIERHLLAVDELVREAVADCEVLQRIAENAVDDPGLSGRAAAHRDRALDRWQAALGARAQLEALYQEVAGAPSRAHAASSRLLDEAGVRPDPVGLSARPAQTAAFIDQHTPPCDTSTTVCRSQRSLPDPGMEL